MLIGKDRETASADVKSGDRMLPLAAEAVAITRTWHFESGTKTSFSTTFVYQLEKGNAWDEQPRVELRLSHSVRITAARYEW